MEVFLPEVASQQGQSYEITHRVHHGCQRHFKTRDHRRNLTWPIDIIEKCSCCVLLRHSINTADIKNQFNNSNLLCSCISLLIIIFLPPPHKKKNTPTHIRSETADQQPLQSLHLPRSVRPEQHLWYIDGQNPAHQLMGSSRMFIGICMALYIWYRILSISSMGTLDMILSLGGWFISTLQCFVRLRYQSEFAQNKTPSAMMKQLKDAYESRLWE